MSIDFGKSVTGNYREGTDREYMITNGLGSFSAGSINGNYSRRYHGLLVASFLPPLDRFLVFHKIEEEIDGISLAVKKIKSDKDYIDKGYIFLDEFSMNPFPKFTYSFNGNLFEKEIFMEYEKNTVYVKYTLISSVKESVECKFNLFFNYRDFHGMGNLPYDTDYLIERKDKYITFSPDKDSKKVYLYSNAINTFTEHKEVIGNIVYDIEVMERGDNKSFDNSFKTGYLNCQMKQGESIYIAASMDELGTFSVDEKREKEYKRLYSLSDKLSINNQLLRDLAIAADTFIVYRKGTNGKTIIAGYPWFGDWGRDTMIALPGLTLSTGRYEDARSILATFAKYCSEGMLPNKFPDFDGEPLYYNTIDASMWYFYAIHKYLEYTGDYDFIKNEIYPSMKEIIDYHIKGTRYGIKLDETDGLISGGDFTTQLTWMDARYEGWAVTPRYGKAVEINALWYNALCVMSDLSKRFGESDEVYAKYGTLVKANFEKAFWNEKEGCLYDYILPEGKNDDIRPNQIFAVSIPYTMLSKDKEKQIVDKVMQKLYTPHGLRSISSDNEKYIGIYKGTLFERDACYHQGTVWSWPIGHLITAHKKAYGNKTILMRLLNGLTTHFYQEGSIRNISEIFDGDAPNTSRGCYAQAWSIGEMIRAIKEDILEEK